MSHPHKKVTLPNNVEVTLDKESRAQFELVIPTGHLVGRHIDTVNDVISFKATGDESLLEDIGYKIMGSRDQDSECCLVVHVNARIDEARLNESMSFCC